jgi:acyl transferase domain-containing protein
VIRAHGTAEARDGVGTDSGHGCRLGIVDPTAKRLATARKIVAAGAAWRGGRDIWFSPRPMLAGGEGGMAFVFPGLEAEASSRVDDVAAHFGLEALSPGGKDFSGSLAGVVHLGQFLHEVLGRIGVRPDSVAGHSLGEWTAAMVSGLVEASWLDDRAAILLNPVALRPDLSHAVIGDSAEAVQARLPGYPGVVLSHDNAPSQSVVCGPADQVALLIRDLGRQNTICRELPFATGVHTSYLAPFVAELRTFPGLREPRPTRIPVWSATIAAPIPDDESQRRELFFRQLMEPVRFRRTVMAMHDAGLRVFLQVGAGQLASLIHDTLRDRDHLVIPVNVDFRSGLAQLRRVATALWVEGGTPDLSALDPSAQPTPARPATAGRSLRMRLELGTERFTLGTGASELLGVAAAQPGASPAAATLQHSALDPSAAAEFTALLNATTDAAAAVLAAAGHEADESGRGREKAPRRDDQTPAPRPGDEPMRRTRA